MRVWLDVGIPMVLALAASLAVLLNLTLTGPMMWHFLQPSALQGGFEVGVMLLALAALAAHGRRWCWYATAVVLGFYLRRHHVDLPLLVMLLAVEGWVAVGALLDRSRPDANGAWAGLRRFVIGLSVWLVVMLAMHALHLAKPPVLLGVLLGGCVVALLWQRRSGVVRPALTAFAAATPASRAIWAVLGGWFAVLLARSNNVIGFDTLWYPTRGQYVLAPNGSFFEPLGLVSPVYYFPKLWELLLLPWDAASDLSFSVALSLALMAVALVALGQLLARLGVRGMLLPASLLAIATLPAVASTALQLKTDIPAWMFMLIALLALSRWFDRPRTGASDGHVSLLWAFCTVALACCSKLTALPFIAALFASMLIVAMRRRHAGAAGDEVHSQTLSGSDWLMLGMTLTIGCTILYRTWLVSGLPTIGPDPLVGLWNALGMHLREPAGTLNWLSPQDWSDAPRLLPEALFAPNALPQMRISWVGNVWLLCGVMALVWRLATRQDRPMQDTASLRISLWCLALTGLILLLAWKYHSRGADGNYFIVAISAACVLGFAFASRYADSPARRYGLLGMLLICAGWQAALGFVSAAWSQPGTRTFDLALTRSPLDSRSTFWRMRESAGLGPVYQVLKRLPPDTRTLVAGLSEQAHLLPTRVEAMEGIGFARPEYLDDPGALRRFLETTCINYVVISLQEPTWWGRTLPQALARLDAVKELQTDRWQLYRLPGCREQVSAAD